jgi:hypothetical protein
LIIKTRVAGTAARRAAQHLALRLGLGLSSALGAGYLRVKPDCLEQMQSPQFQSPIACDIRLQPFVLIFVGKAEEATKILSKML